MTEVERERPPVANVTGPQMGMLASAVSLAGRRAVAWLTAAAAAAVALAIVELGLSVFLQLFLKRLGILNQDVETSRWFGGGVWSAAGLAVGLCVLAVVRSGGQFAVGQSAVISMEVISARLRRLALWEMLLRPSRRLVPAASVNARVGDLAGKATQFCFAASLVVSSGVQAAALACVMFVVASGETVVALVGLGILGGLVLRVGQMMRRVVASVPSHLRVLAEGIERVARNMVLVRILRTQRLEHRGLVTSVDSYERFLVHAGYLGSLVGALTPFAGVVLILVIVGASQRVFHTPGITLLSFLYLFVRFVQAVSSAVSQFGTCNATWPSFKDNLDYVGSFAPAEVDAAMGAGRGSAGAVDRRLSTGGRAPAINVHGLTFAYPGAPDEVLRDISVDVPEGSQLAIVGPSGCGKSTLLALVLGLQDPTRGEVRVDGRTPADFFDDPEVRVGYVGAEAFLIAGSIRENLRYGVATTAGDDALWTALEHARLRATVEALPGGLDYPIAEDGSGLSAGQKQRLCLARALVNEPHVLVLDEASANLDAATEREVAASLRTLRGVCTTIVVSHREGILEFADQTVVLAKPSSGEPVAPV
jgi:ABC-type multidrug transport system fused ATPase/permease subunit